jgi:2-phospho-L-lactate guanylyltransferase
MWALVPFKGTEGAKRRLSPFLSELERRELTLAMVRDVLTALSGLEDLSGVLIVSRSPTAPKLAEEFGAEVYKETSTDLTGAVTQASKFIAHRGGGTMIVHGDVPLATTDEFGQVLAGHSSVTLAPDRYDVGTNCIVSTPPNAFTYQFDGKSFAPHQTLARAAGFEPRIVRLPGLGLDIDTLDDLRTVAATNHACRTSAYIEGSGLASRLVAQHN